MTLIPSLIGGHHFEKIDLIRNGENHSPYRVIWVSQQMGTGDFFFAIFGIWEPFGDSKHPRDGARVATSTAPLNRLVNWFSIPIR